MERDARLNWRHLSFKVFNYAIITIWTIINIANLCPEAEGGIFRYFGDDFLFEKECPLSPPVCFADLIIYTAVQMVVDLWIYNQYEIWVSHHKQTLLHHIVLLLNLAVGAIAGYGHLAGLNLGLMAECTSLFIFWEHLLPPQFKHGLIVRSSLLIAGILWVPFRLMNFPFLVYIGASYDLPMASPYRSNLPKICAYASLVSLCAMTVLNYYWGYLLILKIVKKYESQKQ